jgi:L-aminopeptidase/D-esterase-like protein
MNGTITDVPGIRVGHAHDSQALTGCTVILCEEGAIGGVDQRGGAPGTRETDPLHPLHLVERVHAVVLSGGSAFGLDSATGVVRYLEERGVGFPTPFARVPIVPAAILYDLGLGQPDIRPDAAMGYSACQNASSEPPVEGNVGAGCGASVGKINGVEGAIKAGIGTASLALASGLIIGAVVAVNAFGDVIDPSNGRILAGARAAGVSGEPSRFADTIEVMKTAQARQPFGTGENTVIGVVATNAKLTKEGANKVAQMAHDGLARCIRPAHTMLDGDTIFALSLGDVDVDVSVAGALAAEVFAEAILRGVKAAEAAGGLPALKDLRPG